MWDWRLLVLGGIVLLGELLPIDVPRREGLDRVTTSSAFALAALLLLGPLPAAVALATASVVADAAARLPLLKIAFNAAQYVLSLGAAAAAAVLAGAHAAADLARGLAAAPSPRRCVAFLVVNHVLAGVAAAILAEEPVGPYLLSDLPFQLVTAVCVLALTPVILASAEVSMASSRSACCRCSRSTSAPGRPRATRTARCTTRSPGCPTACCCATGSSACSPSRTSRSC